MSTPIPLDGAVALSHLGLIRARGADAASFLQGQLTNDVATLDRTHARLAGFCSAKGRLQASFTVLKSADDELMLACAADLLEPTLKRLKMFVLRARCELVDARATTVLVGVVGASARTLVGDAAVWERRDAAGGGSLVRLPDVDGVTRCLVARPIDAGPVAAPDVSLDAWRWLEVRSGLPLIEAATVDRFVPQMVNYELVGGVDFRKGCYPGQEVVARSQYRGTVKRRMFLFEADTAAHPGDEVFHSGDAEQPAGMVVNAAMQSGRGTAALVEVKLAALDAGTLHLGRPDGPALRRDALPYPVPSDAALPA